MVFDPSKVDLGSLSQVSPDEPIDDTLDDTLDDNLNFNMSEAVKINPDQHAKELDLSTQSGVPLVGVQSDPAAVEQDIKKSQFNFSEMRESHPVTANQFNDIDNAIIAQDDVDVMQLIEDGLKTVFSTCCTSQRALGNSGRYPIPHSRAGNLPLAGRAWSPCFAGSGAASPTTATVPGPAMRRRL